MYEFKKSAKIQRSPESLSASLMELWKERVAICMVDGDVSQERAEQIAWQEIERMENLREQRDSA
jgi:hypothetical protein